MAAALAGHASIGAPGEQTVRVIALGTHIAAAWAWFGGLAVLAVAVVPRLRAGGTDRLLARGVVRRFWRIAVPALCVLAVTGAYLGGQLVATVDALLESPYGRTLDLKTILVLAAASLGLGNAILAHPRLAIPVRLALPRPWNPRALRGRGIRLEAVAAIGVVVAAALLASSPPARGAAYDPPAATAPQPAVDARANDLLVTVAVRPSRPGPNFIDVGVFDTRIPPPAPVTSVTIQLVGPGGAALPAREVSGTKGRFELAIDEVDQGGDWDVDAWIHRPGIPDASVRVPWTVAPALPPAGPVLESSRSLASIATPVAGVLALGFLVALRLALWRRSVRPRSARARRTSLPLDRRESPT
jgi:copper transport protein